MPCSGSDARATGDAAELAAGVDASASGEVVTVSEGGGVTVGSPDALHPAKPTRPAAARTKMARAPTGCMTGCMTG
jgi:hypothetical protein